MSKKIQGLFLLVCAAVAAVLALSFFSRGTPIEVQMPMVTRDMLQASRSEIEAENERKQNAEAARKRAEMEVRVRRCASDDQCIIVDRDPCGCFSGPKGVTAINSAMSLEFSQMIQAETSGSTVCPETRSTQRQCSPSARAVCRRGACTIVY